MIQPCRIVIPYFENPEMLALQVDHWSAIAGELRDNIKIVLVDDHSVEHPAQPIFERCKAPKMLLRFTEPGLWTQHEARNLGAKECGKEDSWLFMTDMDMVITSEQLYALLSRKLNPNLHYTFERKRVGPDGLVDYRYHCNSFLVRRSSYWHINGYDVDFCGLYGGGYGGDGEFLRQLGRICPRQHLNDITLINYPREAMPDASTTQWDRDEWKKKYREVFDRKRTSGDMRSINPIRRKWERLL